jgi:hypothetical protein
MPVGPNEAKANFTEAEQESVDVAIKLIDQYLMDRYQGGVIKVDFGIELSYRAALRIADAYKKAGWKYVLVNGRTIELNEKPPPDDNPWGR